MISIIVPIYNEANFLTNLIQSILTQLIQDYEVILVDDGSTDSTGRLCKKAAAQDSRFRYIYQKNSGVSSARNHGMKEAKGDFITFLDADDWWMPKKLERQLALLKKNKAAVFCGIAAGVAANALTIFVLCLLFRMEHVHYVTLLPKSITTAIGMGVSEEAGGIVTLTVVSIIITGVSGVIMSEGLFKLFKLEEPIAKGLALGNGAHAIGTAKALELGEVEGAMSSLAIAVAGLMTVIVVPFIANLI